MAIIVAFEFPEVTQAQYQESVDRLTGGAGLNSPSDWPVHGLILHAGGPTPGGGWHVTEVWESRAAFDHFAAVLMPILQEIGVPTTPPMICEAYDVVT
ncbi:hypothetical protein RMN57_30170 [Kitasatospora sp. CM 4170]|uniref:ABM domain-containing protein n=1 Tax=Kitasatospora aburaviensis TaxID=67265 RepID=A0ABW1ERH3_9ACTN|nr:hypothetical protein [Kitasatospora sp. CM 4170]WNM48656.1 hypothetical protein RMN57_30170 [Kitasatospora sp. CM 4170]